ncbi:hypothetical protein Tco_0804614 [Tanacetum coccineum]|uniref:Uncharacterized protein n=1 Tax=Tanacetum coccineum TaxID=301880 RepID=A0ABQ5A7D1_9ASTR
MFTLRSILKSYFHFWHHSWMGVAQGYIPLSYISLIAAKPDIQTHLKDELFRPAVKASLVGTPPLQVTFLTTLGFAASFFSNELPLVPFTPDEIYTGDC